MDNAKQKKCVGVAESAALRMEEDRIGPMRRTGKDMTPVLDQRQYKVAVLVIAKCAVEACKQPTPKHQRKTRREQCRRNPMLGIVEILAHQGSQARIPQGATAAPTRRMFNSRLLGHPPNTTLDTSCLKP
jgi:hypothetical protein